MNLHFTINGRWVDAVSFNFRQRQDKAYLESLKHSLRQRWKPLLDETKATGEFYLDPAWEVNPKASKPSKD